jgi:hypothetical protein
MAAFSHCAPDALGIDRTTDATFGLITLRPDAQPRRIPVAVLSAVAAAA